VLAIRKAILPLLLYRGELKDLLDTVGMNI
jgi:hypothetical protein